MYATSPAAAVVEEVVGTWLKDLLHLPATASFALVTGCQMAHVTCLLAARHALLARRQWDVEKEGLAGSPPIRILTSTEIHGSTIRAIRMLGLGQKHITGLPTDANGRLREDALIEALESSPSQPTIVILQAGDLNIGAFDDFAKLIPSQSNTAPGSTSTEPSASGAPPPRASATSSTEPTPPTPGQPTATSGSTSPSTVVTPS
jgi:glutamate/tyrosine decarboxylase-like PLP-dependent enzyme